VFKQGAQGTEHRAQRPAFVGINSTHRAQSTTHSDRGASLCDAERLCWAERSRGSFSRRSFT